MASRGKQRSNGKKTRNYYLNHPDNITYKQNCLSNISVSNIASGAGGLPRRSAKASRRMQWTQGKGTHPEVGKGIKILKIWRPYPTQRSDTSGKSTRPEAG
jgi:hypothetical protein